MESFEVRAGIAVGGSRDGRPAPRGTLPAGRGGFPAPSRTVGRGGLPPRPAP